MTRKDQIDLILSTAEKDFENISKLYSQSFRKQKLEDSILIMIKNYLENLRTVLDYLAKEILEKNSNKKIRNYFPIIKETATDEQINNFINGYFPDLKRINPILYDYLKSLQPKYDINNSWLSDFNNLCGSNKHEILTLQIRNDQIINKLSFQSGQTFLWSDELVEFESWEKIKILPNGFWGINVTNPIARKNDYLKDVGWVVQKLKKYPRKNTPDLSMYDKDFYIIETFLVGNFYFFNHKQSAYKELRLFLSNIYSIKNKIYELL